MSLGEKEEIAKLLWCYTTPGTSQQIQSLKNFLDEKKISASDLRKAFKDSSEEEHLRAVNALTRIAIVDICRN